MGKSESKHATTDDVFIEKHLRAAFKDRGKKSSDILDKHDIKNLFEEGLDFHMTDDQARILYCVCESNPNEKVQFEEFIKVACRSKDPDYHFVLNTTNFCKNIFKDVDLNEDNQISLSEFKKCSDLLPGLLNLIRKDKDSIISKKEFNDLFNSKLHYSEQEMELFFYSLDRNSNNHLDLKEWLALTDPAYKINDDAYSKLLFSAFDANKDGFIDFKEYQSIVKTDVANMGRSLDEIKADFNTIDLNHDGMISLEELTISLAKGNFKV